MIAVCIQLQITAFLFATLFLLTFGGTSGCASHRPSATAKTNAYNTIGHQTQDSAKRKLKEKEIEFSETAFFKAAYEGDLQLVQLFIAAGMQPETRDQSGQTALVYAVRGNGIEVVKLLEAKGANANARDRSGGTPLMAAAASGSPQLVRLLLGFGADPKLAGFGEVSALLIASHSGNPDIIESLLIRGQTLTRLMALVRQR